MNRSTTSRVLLILLTNVGAAIVTTLITDIIAGNTISRAPHYWATMLSLQEGLTLTFIVLLITFCFFKRK